MHRRPAAAVMTLGLLAGCSRDPEPAAVAENPTVKEWPKTGVTKTFDLTGGVRNVGNYVFDDPIDLVQSRIRQTGRTFFVKLIYRIAE